MKNMYIAIAVLLLSACAGAVQPPGPISLDTAKFPVDTEAFGIETFITDNAREKYQEYSTKSYHKAFAQSKSGAWGWWANSNKEENAMLNALFECRKNNVEKEDTMPCLIVNFNGYWGAGLI